MSNKYLYLLLYPNQSLIASQLEPARFAQHYAQGSTGFFGGNFLFVEVDPDFRNEYFKIDAIYADLKPHEDGRPKATKYICNYRTLEHMDFDALRSLYYCNALGNFVELKPGELAIQPSIFEGEVWGDALSPITLPVSPDQMSVFMDINPTKMVVLTRHNFIDYGKFSVDPDSYVSSPAILYTQINFDIDDFMSEFEVNPFLPIKIPGIHPSRMRDSILEVRTTPHKKNKGILMDCPFDKVSYRNLRLGFMFASREKTRFYPLVSMDDVERDFYKFWKSQ